MHTHSHRQTSWYTCVSAMIRVYFHVSDWRLTHQQVKTNDPQHRQAHTHKQGHTLICIKLLKDRSIKQAAFDTKYPRSGSHFVYKQSEKYTSSD